MRGIAKNHRPTPNSCRPLTWADRVKRPAAVLALAAVLRHARARADGAEIPRLPDELPLKVEQRCPVIATVPMAAMMLSVGYWLGRCLAARRAV